jgi:hypothetical protein
MGSALKKKSAPRPAPNDAAFQANVRPVPTPARRDDRPFEELRKGVAEAAGKNMREYPRTAEQAIANFWAAGQNLTEGEANLIYSMFHQEYPGWTDMITVDPTAEMRFSEPPGSTQPIMRRATPSELLDSANEEFDKAAKQYLWAPERWVEGKYLGISRPPLTFNEDNPWTQVIKENPIYQRMRKGMVKRVLEEEKAGTLDTLIGWRPSNGLRALKWDEEADDAPEWQPLYDAFQYAAGLDLKSTGSVNADLVITNVDRGNRTFTLEVTLTDELRSGSMTRVPGWVPGLGKYEFMKDNSTGPLFYSLPLKWHWTETLRY